MTVEGDPMIETPLPYGAQSELWNALAALKACTHPANVDSVMRLQRAIDAHTIPLAAVEALVADYDDGKLQAPGFVQAIRALQALTKGAAR